MAILKPLLSKIWGSAATGSDLISPDVSKYASGWIFGEKPPNGQMNWLQWTFSKALAHLNENGVLEHDLVTIYPLGAYVWSGGKVYRSRVAANQGNNVVLPSKWQEQSLPDMPTSGDGYVLYYSGSQLFWKDAGDITFADYEGKDETTAASIKFPANNTLGNEPLAAEVSEGELAINYKTQTIYTKNPEGTIIALLGGGGLSTNILAVLSGSASGYEGDPATIIIDNWHEDVTYTLYPPVGATNVSQIGDTITWTPALVSADTPVQFGVVSEHIGVTNPSAQALFDYTVLNVPLTDDETLEYDETTMNEFVYHANTALADTDTTLESIDGIDTANITDDILSSADTLATYTPIFNTDTINVDGTDLEAGTVTVVGGEQVDISSATYDTVTASLTSQDTAPRNIRFNDDGTKMYVLGNTTDSIYQYTLSTAYDISTATYDTVTLSVASQDTSPFGLTFNNEGTKMYVAGIANARIYQYTLATPWDLSSASYDSVFFSVAQDTNGVGVVFNNDGTKMFIAGRTNDSIYQYTLSVAFDLSTCSYDSVSLSIASEETTVNDIRFNNDGTKMYMVGIINDSVFQYTLTTAFDLSTCSYDSISFSVATEETTPNGIEFLPDGTKMYIVGSDTDSAYQYSVNGTINVKEYSIDTTAVTAGGTPATAYINEHRAVANASSNTGGDTTGGIRAIQSTLEFTSVANDSSLADTLYTLESIANGDNLVIVLDDNSVNEIVASGVTLNYDGILNDSIVDTLPTMLSNSQDGYILTANNEQQPAHYAFADDGATTFWQTNTGGTTEDTLIVELPSPEIINKFGIMTVASARAPKDYFLEASNTGAFAGEEVTLITLTGEPVGDGVTFDYKTFVNDTAYKYYRFRITANNGDVTYMIISEIKLIEAVSIYEMDTTATTAGEIPSRTYAVDANPLFEISGGFIESPTVSDVYTLEQDITTLDPLTKGSDSVLSNGNLTVTDASADNANSNVYSDRAVTYGDVYAEITVDNEVAGMSIGIASINTYQANRFHAVATGYAYLHNGNKESNGSSVAYGATYTTGDIIGIRYNYINGELEFYKFDGVDTMISQGIAYTLAPNTPVYIAGKVTDGSAQTFNFGATAFADQIVGTAKIAEFLNTVRQHTDMVDLTGSLTIQAKMFFKHAKTKMTNLIATIQKLGA